MSDEIQRHPHPAMMPMTASDERLTLEELHESTDLLSIYRTVVGDLPDETVALMKALLLRRDGGARVVMTHLRWCLAYEESA
jgi:hypothetical protein